MGVVEKEIRIAMREGMASAINARVPLNITMCVSDTVWRSVNDAMQRACRDQDNFVLQEVLRG